MEIVYLLGGLLIGAVITWLFVKQKSTGEITILESKLKKSRIFE